MVDQGTYDELHQRYEQLVLEREDFRTYKEKLDKAERRIQELMEHLILLQRRMFCAKSERHPVSGNDLQGSLFEVEPLPEEPVRQTELVSYKRRKKSERPNHSGRNPFPEHLPAEEKTILHPLADPDRMVLSERMSASVCP